jgi:hypothetical protein
MQDEPDKSLASTTVRFGAAGEIHQICTANPKRRAIAMSCAANIAIVSTNQNDLMSASQPGAVAAGLQLVTAPALIFNRRDHGALCTSAWFAAIPVNSDQIIVFEAVDP